MRRPTRQADRLAQAAAKAKAQRDAHQRTLQIIRAAQRKADKAAQAQRRQDVGAIAEHYGLTTMDDPALHQAFLLLSRLLTRGQLSWALAQTAPDPATAREEPALRDGTVPLVGALKPEAPDPGSHTASGDAGEEESTTLIPLQGKGGTPPEPHALESDAWR